MKGLSGQGCTHQVPLLANTTICWPGRAPATRPEITSTLSRPPCAAGGIFVNSTVGVEVVCREWQLLSSTDADAKKSSSRAAFHLGTAHLHERIPHGPYSREGYCRRARIESHGLGIFRYHFLGMASPDSKPAKTLPASAHRTGPPISLNHGRSRQTAPLQRFRLLPRALVA